MSEITSIETQQRRKNRCSIFIDRDFFCGVAQETVARLKLKPGQAVEPEKLKRIVEQDEKIRAREMCLRALEVRVRSRHELAERLNRRGVEEAGQRVLKDATSHISIFPETERKMIMADLSTRTIRQKRICIVLVNLMAIFLVLSKTHSNPENFNVREYEKGYYEYILNGKYEAGIKLLQRGINHQSDDGGWTEGKKHRTYSATAFFAVAVGKAYLALNDKKKAGAAAKNLDSWKASLEKANEFLMTEKNWRVSPEKGFKVPIYKEGVVPGHPFHNQLAAAAFANYLTYIITDNLKYKHDSQKLIHFIIGHQSEEGWYPEKGGADSSYNAVTILMLQQIYRYEKKSVLLSSINKSLDWQKTKVLKDGTISIKGNSRVIILPDARAVALVFWNWKQFKPEYEIIARKVAGRYKVSQKVFNYLR